MRNMFGFEVLDRLISVAPPFARIPFVFLTGQTDQHSRLRVRKLGVDDYLVKPVDFDLLGSIIKSRLAQASARDARLSPV